MEGHTAAVMPKEQLEVCGTSCWGTCEELLLVSAVNRHGSRNWTLISEELMARSVSLNVSPRFFSESACKKKYDILRERYANSSISSRSRRSEDLENDSYWCEELRRLRVAHLKRELVHYEGSVGTLQVKIRRLKAENLALLSRETNKNSHSTEEVRVDSSCQISVHRSTGRCVDHHAAPFVLLSKMDSDEDMWCQEPSYVRKLAFPEDKVVASFSHEHPELSISRIGYHLADGYEVAGSMVSHEAGDTLSDAVDNDEGNATNTDGQQLFVKMNVSKDEMGSGHIYDGQKGMDRILEISAGSILNTEASKNGGSDHAATDTHSEDVFFPIRPLSQLLLSSGSVVNAEDWKADRTTVTVERINLSKNEEGVGEFKKKRTIAIESAYPSILQVDLMRQIHVALPLDLTKAESGMQLRRNSLECYANIARTTPAIDPFLKSSRKTISVSVGGHNLLKGLTSDILDEVACCDQKQLLWEEDSLKAVDTTFCVVKKLATLGVESEELDRCSDDVVGEKESVTTSKGSEKIRASVVVPTMSLVNLKNFVFGDATTFILEKSGLSESASRSSGFSYESDVSEGSSSPERHIMIVRNGPCGLVSNSETFSISPANGEYNNAYQIVTPTRSVYNLQARTVEELHISDVSCRISDSCEEMDWETPHETPAIVRDLLEEVHMTGQANPFQCAALVIRPVQFSDVANCTIVSPAIVSTFEPGKSSPIVAVRVGHDAETALRTVIHCDCTLEIAREDFDPQYSSAIHGVDLENGSHRAESKLPEIILDMNLEYSKAGLYGVESDAEPSSPLDFLTGGSYSMMPSGFEGTDSVHGQFKDKPGDRNRSGIQENEESDAEKSVTGSLVGSNEMSPSISRYRKETRVPRKLFPLLEVFRNLYNHKSAIFFKGRQEDPRYSSLIRRHLDLNSVRSRLDEGSYSSSSEFFRDLFLIFNNAMVYYTRGSVQYRGAMALVDEASKEMNRVFQTESLLKQDRPATRTREVKKPIASAGVSVPRKTVVPVIGADSSRNLADVISPLTNLPASGIRKRSSSRLGFVETLINSQSEAVAARSISASFLDIPSFSGTEDAEYYCRENNQEVNGNLKNTKSRQKGSDFRWCKRRREELLEVTLVNDVAIMSLQGTQMRGVIKNEAQKPAMPMPGVRERSMTGFEFAKQRGALNEKTRCFEVQRVGRSDINENDFPQKGKTIIKLRGLHATSEKEADGKPIPKFKATATFRVDSKFHGTVSQVVGRSFRGGREPVAISNERVRPSEARAKKRLRK